MAQADLRRIALDGDCAVADPAGGRPGRGAYVCGAPCAHAAMRPGVLARAFRRPVTVPDDFVESMDL